jgi:hypothetical protein
MNTTTTIGIIFLVLTPFIIFFIRWYQQKPKLTSNVHGESSSKKTKVKPKTFFNWVAAVSGSVLFIVGVGMIILEIKGCVHRIAQPTPPPPTNVWQLPYKITPCKIFITKTTELETDGGEPVYVLPYGWPREKAILYSGKGDLILKNKSIEQTINFGDWEFWSSKDPNKPVTIKISERSSRPQ